MHGLHGHDHLGSVRPGSGLWEPASGAEVPEELAAADKLQCEEDVGGVLEVSMFFFFFLAFLGSSCV